MVAFHICVSLQVRNSQQFNVRERTEMWILTNTCIALRFMIKKVTVLAISQEADDKVIAHQRTAKTNAEDVLETLQTKRSQPC